MFEDKILEKPYGWYFRYQSKAYFESGNRSDALVGSGGFIVDRENGRIFEFGSRDTLERNLATYEAGFKFHHYDLTIKSVSDLETTVKLLGRLTVRKLEEKRRFALTHSEIQEALSSLPHTFVRQTFRYRIEAFWEIDALKCCEYELREHQGEQG